MGSTAYQRDGDSGETEDFDTGGKYMDIAMIKGREEVHKNH